jgi:hypothetical protein
MWVEIAVNGHQLAGADCEPMPSLAHWENSARLMSDFGVQVGEPAIFTLTPKHVSDYSAGIPGRQKPLPANGTYALAIGERIPFEAYPLPPRPATLTAIDFHSDRPVVARVDSDPGDPLRPMGTTITWTGSTLGLIASQTPGFLPSP